MSSELMKRVWSVQVGQAEKLVLMRLAWSGNDDGSGCRRTVADLAAAACVWERSAQSILKRMVSAGWLEVQDRARQHRATTYRIALENLPGVQASCTPDDISGAQDSCTPEAQPDLPGVQLHCIPGGKDGPSETDPRGAAATLQGCSSVTSRGAAQLHPISTSSVLQQEERTPRLAAGPARGATDDKDPYPVVQRLTWQVVIDNPDEDTMPGLIELVKCACARHGIDVGPHSDAVHRAVRSVMFQQEKQQLERKGGAL